MLRKKLVKSLKALSALYMRCLIRGFLFVFPEVNLYNAARLAGRAALFYL